MLGSRAIEAPSARVSPLPNRKKAVYSTGIEARSAHTAAARAASTAPRPRLTATSSGPATTVTPSPRLEIALAAYSRAKSAPSLGCRPRPVTDTTSRVGGWLVGRRPPGSPGTTGHASAGSLSAGSMAPAPGRRCSRPQAMPGPRSARPLRAVEPSPVQPDDVPASSGDGREGQLWASFRSEAGPSTVPRSTTVMSTPWRLVSSSPGRYREPGQQMCPRRPQGVVEL